MNGSLFNNVKFLHPVGVSTCKYGVTIPLEAQTAAMLAVEKGGKVPVTSGWTWGVRELNNYPRNSPGIPVRECICTNCFHSAESQNSSEPKMKENNMETAEKLELHYYFDNTSHAMNAFVRNKCEAEVLAIFQEIASTLGIQIVVESVAYREGGLKEIWQFLGKNKDQITLLIAIIVLILSRFPPTNSEQDKLAKELTKVTIEEKILNIEKLKRELHSGPIQNNAVESVSSAMDGNLKVAARKSNFYKNLIGYKRVTGIGLTPLSKDSTPTEIEKFIGRPDFNKFILLTDRLPVLVIEGASIEIVAPVLKEGNYHWRGIYQGTTIGFSMIDEEFKNSVLREEVSFQHGSTIECVLNIHRKIDEIGDIVITGYSVVTVIKKSDGVKSFETIQGKRYLAQKKDAEDQIDLF